MNPSDIFDSTKESGYRYVGRAGASASKPWRAQKNAGARYGSTDTFRGPPRATALEAAWDYCNYMSGTSYVPSPPTLKSAGHSYARDRDPEVEAALGFLKDVKAQRDGKQGYVYCIREVVPGDGFDHVKIGYSVNPWKRVAELQCGNPRPLAIVCLKRGTTADEKALHTKYIEENILQEWFTATMGLLLEFDLDAEGNPHDKEAASA